MQLVTPSIINHYRTSRHGEVNIYWRKSRKLRSVEVAGRNCT
ncbi:hypothetical protein [Dolichospermum circinale]|nr:hypothetical protein [Dolichospermum circinale]MDB9449969.1 hypothetical protein [Dolichospermum circinale CS-547]